MVRPNNKQRGGREQSVPRRTKREESRPILSYRACQTDAKFEGNARPTVACLLDVVDVDSAVDTLVHEHVEMGRLLVIAEAGLLQV